MSPTDTESGEPKATSTSAASPASPAAPRKKKKLTKIVRPPTENEINVPDRQTLGMVSVMAGLSVVLWIFAHAGCNYHPPRETRVPRVVTTQDLTRDPKDAAIELQQRLATANYKGAAEIAAGPLLEEVKREQASCGSDVAGCEARKKAAANAITSAIVLEREATSAKVRVTTHRLPGGAKTYLALAEREGGAWKVTARIPDAPDARLPAPTLPQAPPIQLMPMPTPSGRVMAPPGSPPTAPPAPMPHP